MSELNISLIFSGDKNKCGYISSKQVGKNEGEACINYQAVTEKQIWWLGTAQVSKKRRSFLPEDKIIYESIKERISNRLKLYSRWIKNKIRM